MRRAPSGDAVPRDVEHAEVLLEKLIDLVRAEVRAELVGVSSIFLQKASTQSRYRMRVVAVTVRCRRKIAGSLSVPKRAARRAAFALRLT